MNNDLAFTIIHALRTKNYELTDSRLPTGQSLHEFEGYRALRKAPRKFGYVQITVSVY